MPTASHPPANHPHVNIFSVLMQVVGVVMLCLVFCLGTLLTHPHIYALASSADGLALFDLANDILHGASLAAWNFPRAPTFFPDTLITLIGVSLSTSVLTIITIISTINAVFFSTIFWLILQKSFPALKISPIKTCTALLACIIATVFLLPDTFGTIFYQIFTIGTHLDSALLAMLIIYLLQARVTKPWRIVFLITLWGLSALGALSNPMITFLIGIWIAKQVLCQGIKATLLNSQTLLVIFGILMGTIIYLALPRQSLTDSFLATTHWQANIAGFVAHLVTTPSALIFYILLIAAALLWPFWEKGVPFAPKHWGKLLLQNDFALLSLSIIAICPIMYQEWTSLRYLMFPALVFLLRACAQLLSMISRHQSTKLSPLTLLFYLGFTALFGLYCFSNRPVDQASQTLQEQLLCIDRAKETFALQDGIATYWHARPLRYGSHFEHYLAQVRPMHPQLGFFFWGNNGLDFIYANPTTGLLRDYNYIVATEGEIANNLWGKVLQKASDQIQCGQSTLYFYADSAILWNYLFGKNQVIIPDTLAGLVKKQDDYLQRSTLIFTANDLFTQVGQLHHGQIVATQKSGYLVYGPYIHLAPGKYQLLTNGDLSEAKFEISANRGTRLLLEQPITLHSQSKAHVSAIDFTIEQAMSNVEFRIVVSNKSAGNFQSFELRKL